MIAFICFILLSISLGVYVGLDKLEDVVRSVIKPEYGGASSSRPNRLTSDSNGYTEGTVAVDQDVRNAIGTAIAALSSLVHIINHHKILCNSLSNI